MAEQDFNINIRTLADLTGIKLTQAQLESLQSAAAAGNQKAAQALTQLANAQKQAQETSIAGLSGTAIGVGTIISLVTGAISKWKAFNDEQDRMVEGMIKAEEKSRELGLSVADMMDAMRSKERIDTEPLQVSFDRLKQKVIELKTEMKLAFEAGEYEDVKKYASALGVVESQLNGVTNAMRRQTEEADRNAKANEKARQKDVEDREKFEQNALGSANIDVQRVLMNEAAARRTGDQGFQKAAEAYERGLGPDQRAELEQLRVLEQIRDAWR